MLRLAESERQEISAAYDEAEEALAAAGEAMTKLMSVLQKTAACVSMERVRQLEKASTTGGAKIFEVRCQRYYIQDRMKFNRVLE